MTDVELSDAAPTPAPEPLTAEQGEELVAAIDEIRKANRNVTRRLHGWTLEWKTRPRGTQRGDLCAIDPRDGQKLFSTASVQRKLLSGSSAAPPSDDAPKDDDDPSASAAKGSRVPRAVSQLNSQLVLDAPEASDGGRRPSRSTRTVVNYAELNTVSPRMPDQILKALDRLDPEKTLGADLVDLADGVHTLGDLVLEETRPFAAVQRTLLKDRLPINTDPACFGCPTGWEEGRVENGRRPKKIWTRRAPAEPDDGDGVSGGGGGMSDDGRGVEEGVSELTVMERRIELEALLEREAAEAGKPYLGHVIGGAWQISSKAITSALMHVLSGLVAIGRLKELPPKLTGKASVCWIASNTYVRGEPFPREPKAASGKRKKDDDADDDEPEEEEQLADIELERLRNIERNREILRQLGLA